MNNDSTRKIKTAASIFAFLLLVTFMIPQNDPSESIRRSLAFCASSLVPSLFMSVFLGKMLASGLNFKTGSVDIKIILLGFVCGFPFGAICANELYKNGNISREKAEELTASSNSASASFVISYVGKTLLNNVKAGVFLFLGNVLITFIWYFLIRTVDKNESRSIVYTDLKRKSNSALISESVQTMMGICGCVVFFSALFDLFCKRIGNEVIKAALHGFFEISGGLKSISGLKPEIAYVLSAMIIGWSGISVIMQVSMASGKDIRIRRFLLGRIFQASGMGLFALLTRRYIL